MNRPDINGMVILENFSECQKCGHVGGNMDFLHADRWSVKHCPNCDSSEVNTPLVPDGCLFVG